MHKFEFLPYDFNHLVSDWLKVSSGFLASPQKAVYDRKKTIFIHTGKTPRVWSLDGTVDLVIIQHSDVINHNKSKNLVVIVLKIIIKK